MSQHSTRFDHSLYAIVDPQIARGRSLADLARVVAEAGATAIQYRAKAETTRAMVDAARAIHNALRGTGVPLLINDRVDVALAVGAEGVHIGRDDLAGADARRLLGPRALIGVTIKSEDDFAAVAEASADYACIGGVFSTRHKTNPDEPLGLDNYQRVRAALRARQPALPVGAIAGITADNAADVIRAGADGIAVIGALFDADDIGARTRQLAAIIAAARRSAP